MLSARNRAIRKHAALRGYDQLQSMYGSKSQKYVSDDNEPVFTKPDRCLIATNNLYTTASRLKDASTILESCVSLLKNDVAASMHKRRLMATTIRKLIIPLNERAATLIKNAARDSAPIAGCSDYHKKCEARRKKVTMKELAKKKKGGSIEVELILEYLKVTATPDVRRKSSPTAKPITPRAVKRCIAKVTPDKATDIDDVTIPLPADRASMEYTKPEAVEILSSQTNKFSDKRMKMMMKMTTIGWAPTSVRTLQRLLTTHERGCLIINDAWSGSGRKPAMTYADMDNLVGQ